MSYLSYANKYTYAPYEFIKGYNLIWYMKKGYFLVEFYFLVDFLEKKLPLEIVQFIFAIVKEKQENLRALHIASWAYQTIPNVMTYQTIPNVMPYERHFKNSVPWDRHPDPDPEAAAEAAAKAEARAEAKKNKKLWVKKKKEKLLEYKNRGLKR